MPKIKSEIRKDYLLDKYVIVTPGRATRPRDIKGKTVKIANKKCPFCPKNIAIDNVVDTIPNQKNWQVLSLKNIFPAVSLENNKAYGKQEVIIDTPDHAKDLADLSIKQIEQLLEMYAKRTAEISKNKKIDYILCFKNQGAKAGASIQHAHSQVFASKIIPPDLITESQAVKKYYQKNKRCAYCDIIKKEAKGSRKIMSDKNIIAFTPYASAYHYEAWIFPKRHLDNIILLNKEEFASLAKIMKKILVKMQKLNLSFNYFLHNVISNKEQHFYIKIQPRDSVWAGVELGSGLVINSIPPEQAARYYRSKPH